MKKKILFKTLGIVILLAGLVLAYFTGRGIVEGNKAYDLFRKIRVDMKDVYKDIDQNGLEAVKDEFRGAFTVVDQMDALGGKKAQKYLDDVNTAYGLIDTLEATNQVVASINGIGPEKAQEGLDLIYAEVEKAEKTFGFILKTNGGDVAGYLQDIGTVLEKYEDPDEARQELNTMYASDLDKDTAELVNGSYDENKAKMIRTFFDEVFKMVKADGKDEAMAYLTAAAEAVEYPSDEFARTQVEERIREDQGEEAEPMLEYCGFVFRLIEDQDAEHAQTYLQHLLDTMKKTGVTDARAFLTEEYGNSEGDVKYAKYLDSAFRTMDEVGAEEAKLLGGDICAEASVQDETKAEAFLTFIDEELAKDDGSAGESVGGAVGRLIRMYDLVQEAESISGGRNNLYLIDLYTVRDAASSVYKRVTDAQTKAEKKAGEAETARQKVTEAETKLNQAVTEEEKAAAQEELDSAQAACEKAEKDAQKAASDAQKIIANRESEAQEQLENLQNAIVEMREVMTPENRDKARLMQNDMCTLIDRIGLDRAKKYTEYATQKALDDKTLRITALGTDNVQKLEALDDTKVTLMRNKARLMIGAAACLIIGIVLIMIRPRENDTVRMSREERRAAGSHMGLSTSRAIANTAIHAVLILISIIWLIPFISIVMQSLRVESTHQVGYIMPEKLGFNNYVDLFKTNFPRWYTNTFIMAVVVAVLQTVIVLCMSYTLSRFRFKMCKGLMRFMLILGMFPGMLTMIILYRVLRDLNLTQANAVPGLILVYVASSGMGYYVSKGFFDTIPKSLDEAARVDGATRAQVLMKIILPLSKPIVIYTVLTAFMGPWGDYVFARYISFGTSDGMNAAVGLNNWLSKDQIASRYTMFCAGGVLVAIPVAVLFMCLQRYYVEGVTGGAVKG